MNKINSRNVRGMHDVFGKEAKVMHYILENAKQISHQYNFEFLETPILEFSEIFERAIGDTSDIISKEIYSFMDRSENKLALRPEFTAAIIRAVASNKMHMSLPLKLFSHGPVFRYDRPQKCRQRQFHQINYEFIGVKQNDPCFDVEMIMLAMQLLKEIGLLEISSYKLHINSIGNEISRQNFAKALQDYLGAYKNELSPESLIRLEKNPLRILDSKFENEQEILKNGPKISDFYDEGSKNFFEKLLFDLDELEIEYIVDEKLVRGLDYYDHTVFEIITDELGAQGTILAGGRYANLTEFFGIGKIPCFGFAAGVERIMSLILDSCPDSNEQGNANKLELLNKILLKKEIKISILGIGEENSIFALKILKNLKSLDQKRFTSEILIEKKLQKLLEKANKNQSHFAILVGENEVKENKFIVRNLHDGQQYEIQQEKLLEFFKNLPICI